jgi:gentisate 1,2-dioxygenase
MHESERRSLIMCNPALEGQIATTTTMFAAYRINNPNEIAPAHRHSPNAIRFGLTGNTNFTGVEGEPITFGFGDLVLTPHDTWHNHGNEGEGGAVNLSVLDMPLVNTLNATYFESDYFEEDEKGEKLRKDVQEARFPSDYSERVYGQGGLLPRSVSHHRGTGNASPMYVYRWEPTRQALENLRDRDGSLYDGVLIEYVDPTTGKAPYSTMTFFAQMLRPGEATLASKQNASLIYTVLEGAGHSIIGGQRFDWEPFDTFCVPGGEWVEHANGSGSQDAILFVSSDEPVLKTLRFYMRHGRTPEGDLAVIS